MSKCVLKWIKGKNKWSIGLCYLFVAQNKTDDEAI
jgi:hypothetical protein